MVSHPATAPHVRAAAMTYSIAGNDEYKHLAKATSHITGRSISRFTHIHQNVEDLMKKVKLLRVLGQKPEPVFNGAWGLMESMRYIPLSTKSIKNMARIIWSVSRNG